MEGLLGRLSALIPGSAGMSDEDKRALITQGLLQFGAATLANNKGNYGKAGPAIGAGLLGGLDAINTGSKQLADNKYKQQVMAMQSADPAGFRTLDLAARAAGYEPGTQGYKDFFRRNNGEIARQSSAAIQYRVEKGEDGVPRLIALDPRDVGAQVVGGGETYGSGVGGYASGTPSSPQVKIDGIPQADQARIAQVVEAMSNAGYPKEQIDAFVASQLPQGEPTFTPAPAIPRPSPSAGANPFRGRRPEDEAAAIAAAEQAARLQYAPAFQAAATQGALNTSQGQAEIRNNAEIDQLNRKRTMDAGTAIGLLDEAETILEGGKATGSLVGHLADSGAAVFGRSTEGAQATAGLKAIAGQLTSKMPRMEGPQGVQDVILYQQMAGELGDDTKPVKTRLAAAKVIRTLQEKYATQGAVQQPASPNRIRYDAQGNRIP